MVLVTLAGPREKFWGVLLQRSAAGVCVRGIDLNCFDDFAAQVCAGEPVSPGEVFFPMHRVERVELDAANGAVASLGQRFQARTGRAPAALLGSLHLMLPLGVSLAAAQAGVIAATLSAVENDVRRAAAILGIGAHQIRSLLR